jgi:hypothetical protein
MFVRRRFDNIGREERQTWDTANIRSGDRLYRGDFVDGREQAGRERLAPL